MKLKTVFPSRTNGNSGKGATQGNSGELHCQQWRCEGLLCCRLKKTHRKKKYFWTSINGETKPSLQLAPVALYPRKYDFNPSLETVVAGSA